MEQMLHTNHLILRILQMEEDFHWWVCSPQLKLNACTTRPAFIYELRKSQGNLHNATNSMIINTVEISRTDTSVTRVLQKPNNQALLVRIVQSVYY